MVGGLALAVLLVAGAAIASVLASRTPEDWNQVGLVVTRGDQPATYVILEEKEVPELIPVINITSAQLILGADVKATSVDQEVVDEQTPGIPIGILGAPQTLPRPKQFIETGWTACTDDQVGIAVNVSQDENVERTTSEAIVVKSVDSYWLIATSSSREADDQRAYRYRISEAEGDQFFGELRTSVRRAQAIEVPPEWLALFPEGGEIGPAGFDLPRFGKLALDSPVPGANVGDYIVLDDGRGAMVDDNGYQPLDPFALAMLQNMGRGPRSGKGPRRRRTLKSDVPGARTGPSTSADAAELAALRPAGRRDRPGAARVAGRPTRRVTRSLQSSAPTAQIDVGDSAG